MTVLYDDIKSLPITDYLAFKGILPVSKVTNEAYYLSPFRGESKPSLAVNMNKNVWFDFGDNVGGSIIDLALKLHNGDRLKANDELAKFAVFIGESECVQKDTDTSMTQNNSLQEGIRIINNRDISHKALIQLISNRGIGMDVARRYCREVWFESKDGRRCFAIGLPNIINGWELRGLKSFKSSTQPKAASLIRSGVKQTRVCVFEGLFDMLSYAAYCYLNKNTGPSCDLLCMNSLALLNSTYSMLCGYEEIDLYLDSDPPGRNATSKLLHMHTNVRDKSTLYSSMPECKDLNQWYIHYLRSRSLTNDQTSFSSNH